MGGIPLQPGIIYGPVFSRRLGRSLGINLLSIHQKMCSYDCIYCQYGPAKVWDASDGIDLFPSVETVLSAVEKALNKPRTIEYLTFSGNGEPTLHPDFAQIVQAVYELRNRYRPDAKIALLSNAFRVVEPQLLSVFRCIDAPMMKLDAGDEQTFSAINRPGIGIDYHDLVEGLKRVPNLIIQSLLIEGEISNVRGAAYDAWSHTLAEVQPSEIHIYTVERPPATNFVFPVEPKKLEKIALDLIQRFNLNVQAFW